MAYLCFSQNQVAHRPRGYNNGHDHGVPGTPDSTSPRENQAQLT